MIFSPVLAQFDPNKLTCFWMECSAEATVCILIKPDDDKESHQSEKSIIKNGEYKFDLKNMEQDFNL